MTHPNFLPLTRKIGFSLLSLCVTAAAGSYARSAHACGGFFCSASQPVNQAAERIIFAQGDGEVTQIVEVLYDGPSERFAWVLPVPGAPEIGVSSSVVLDRLQAATNPNYTLNTISDCESLDFSSSANGGAAAGPAGEPNNGTPPSVTVVDEGSVGPFDYETISVQAEDQDPAAVALRWLEANGYDVGSLGAEVLRPYLENGLNLLAVRLQKGVAAGAIRPLALKFESQRPSIPIRPTAVAANDDMGVMVWLVGQSRGVPVNYLGLELNEALIDWTTNASNYGAVVSAAANEAGGQGFVTEFAGETSPFVSQIAFAQDLEGFEFSSASLTDLASLYGQYDGFVEALDQHAEFRDSLTAADFIACPQCYYDPSASGAEEIYGEDFDDQNDPLLALDLEAFQGAVRETVLQPIEDAAELFEDHPYVTRLYTTMSAAEMTLDPVFDFNPDLDDVSNQHSATRRVGCSGTGGPWSVELSDGRILRGEGAGWPFAPGGSNPMPLNVRTVSFSTSGLPTVVDDNREIIDGVLEGMGMGSAPATGGAPTANASGGSSSADDERVKGSLKQDGLCVASGAPGSGTSPFARWSVLAALLAFALRRRSGRSREERVLSFRRSS